MAFIEIPSSILIVTYDGDIKLPIEVLLFVAILGSAIIITSLFVASGSRPLNQLLAISQLPEVLKTRSLASKFI